MSIPLFILRAIDVARRHHAAAHRIRQCGCRAGSWGLGAGHRRCRDGHFRISGTAVSDATALGGLRARTVQSLRPFGASLVASASNLGPIIPPSAGMILYASGRRRFGRRPVRFRHHAGHLSWAGDHSAGALAGPSPPVPDQRGGIQLGQPGPHRARSVGRADAVDRHWRHRGRGVYGDRRRGDGGGIRTDHRFLHPRQAEDVRPRC